MLTEARANERLVAGAVLWLLRHVARVLHEDKKLASSSLCTRKLPEFWGLIAPDSEARNVCDGIWLHGRAGLELRRFLSV